MVEEEMRSSSAFTNEVNWGVMAGGRRACCWSSGIVLRSMAMRASAAARSAGVGSGSMSRWGESGVSS